MKGLAIREYEIGKSDNLKYWPFYLRYIFDQNNLKALSIIILSIYDTFSERIMKTTFKENSENPRIKKKIFLNRWKESINALIMDEDHKCRHLDIRIVAMMKNFRTRIY
jgi:hypothetical protein